MNAILAMALNRVVCSGAEVEGIRYLGLENCPVRNITPNPEQICATIIEIAQDRSRIEEIGAQSRTFVEREHNAGDVALRFLDAWTENS